MLGRARRLIDALILIWLVSVLIFVSMPVRAQNQVKARTTGNLNVRLGPGKGYDSAGYFKRGIGLILEGRTADNIWLLARDEGGTLRGWITNQYLVLAPGFKIASLPISAEVVNRAAPTNPQPNNPAPPVASNATPGPIPQANAAATTIKLPANAAELNERLRAIYAKGRQLGNKPGVFIRLGDSIIAYHLLHPFASRGSYALGQYAYLQPTVNFFRASMADGNLSAQTGFTMDSELDPTWAPPGVCQPGETVLTCEMRIKKPSVAIVYLGPNDLHSFPLPNFAENTTRVIQVLLDHGVIPVIVTFAVRGDRLPDRVPGYIQVLRDAAARQQVPLIDFHEAAKALPANGVVQDAFHMTHRANWATYFTGDEHLYGETLLELLTLQMLDDLRRNVIE